MSDHKGGAIVVETLPPAKPLIGDQDYDSDRLWPALSTNGIPLRAPPTKNRRETIEYDKMRYKQRHRIENLVAKLKHSRRIATRYDRCVPIFFSALCFAAAALFFLYRTKPDHGKPNPF